MAGKTANSNTTINASEGNLHEIGEAIMPYSTICSLALTSFRGVKPSKCISKMMSCSNAECRIGIVHSVLSSSKGTGTFLKVIVAVFVRAVFNGVPRIRLGASEQIHIFAKGPKPSPSILASSETRLELSRLYGILLARYVRSFLVRTIFQIPSAIDLSAKRLV
jgi:hypothetical protein